MFFKINGVLLTCMTAIFIMSASENEDKHEVFEKTALNIQKINKDGGCLYYYFKGVFQALGKDKRQVKPSEILSFFSTEDSGINAATPLLYMPATRYVGEVIKPSFEQLDKDFAKKLEAENNDIQRTWSWFDEHFKQHGLTEPFKTYKMALIKADKERVQLAKKGVHLSDDGRTAFIRPPASSNPDDECSIS